MTIHTDSRIIFAAPQRLFDLVADVESYPDFLPLWKAVRVYRREENDYYTEQIVGLGPVRERFRTHTALSRHTRIEVTSLDQLFQDFFIRWDFAPTARGCRVDIALKWQLRSTRLQRAIDLLLPQAARSMVSAFERRAHEVL